MASSYQGKNAEDLFDLFRAGDENAFTYLIEQHEFARKVNRQFISFRVLDADDRQELLNDYFLYLHEHNSEFDKQQAQLITYARKKVYWMAKTYHRKRQAEREGRAYDPIGSDSELTPDMLDITEQSFADISVTEDRTLVSMLNNALYDTLRHASGRARDVFTYRFLYGKTFAEISDILEVNEATLRSDFHRAVGDFTRELRQRGFDSAGLDALSRDSHSFQVNHRDLEKLVDTQVRQVATRYLEGGSLNSIARAEQMSPNEVRTCLDRALAELLRTIVRALPTEPAVPVPDEQDLDRFTDALVVLGAGQRLRAAYPAAHPYFTTIRLIFRALTGGDPPALSLGASLRQRQREQNLTLDALAAALELTPPRLGMLLTDTLSACELTGSLQARLCTLFGYHPDELAALVAVTTAGAIQTATATRNEQDIDFSACIRHVRERSA